MSMNTALTGLSAAQKDISVTSHNIANVNTTGFRGSRAEFADIFTQSPFSVARTTAGSGTQVARVAQDFSQGSVMGTGNRLDLAIEGSGFFALRADSQTPGTQNEPVFSRAGAFGMSADGHIVNSDGQRLLGWPVARDGTTLSESLPAAIDLQIPLAMGTPMATSSVSMELRLPADPAQAGGQTAVPPMAAFDPADATSWAHRTQIPLYDAQGRAVEGEIYLVRMSNPAGGADQTDYAVHMLLDGVPAAATLPNTLSFDAAGDVIAAPALQFTGPDGPVALDLAASRLGNTPFAVETAAQNGRTTSQLTTLDIDAEGTVWATYGADARVARGKLLLVNFPNPGALRPMGAASFGATTDAGEPLAGSPGGAGFGRLRSGALEMANVDLTEELVGLITAQRNYQANAKAMETSSQMMQTIMNLRS